MKEQWSWNKPIRRREVYAHNPSPTVNETKYISTKYDGIIKGQEENLNKAVKKSRGRRVMNDLAEKSFADARKNIKKNFMKKGIIKSGKNTFLKQSGKTAFKKVLGFLGGKTSGVLGMMTATSAKADQPGTGSHGGEKTPSTHDMIPKPKKGSNKKIKGKINYPTGRKI